MPPPCGMAARNYRQRCRGQICRRQRGRTGPRRRGGSAAAAARSEPCRGHGCRTRSLIRTLYPELCRYPPLVLSKAVPELRCGEVSQVPAPSAVASAAHRPAPAGDRLREALLTRVQPATAPVWTGQDAELDAETAALDADRVVPTAEELAGQAPDPYAGPPEGMWGWLADLPGPLLEEYLDAAEPRGPGPLAAGRWDGAAGEGRGFAAGGVADELAPGPVLAGLADDVAAGLGRCSDDELIGVLRAGRRLASWSASLELSAAGDGDRR